MAAAIFGGGRDVARGRRRPLVTDTDDAILDALRGGPLSSWLVTERIMGAERAAGDSARVPVQRALQALKRRGLVALVDKIRWALTPMARTCPMCGAKPRECCIGGGKSVIRQIGTTASYAVHPARAETQAQEAE